MKRALFLLTAFTLLCLFPGCIVRHLIPRDDSGFFMPSPMADSLTDSAFVSQCRGELQQVARCSEGLEHLTAYADSNAAAYNPGAGNTLDQDQKNNLASVWNALQDYLFALEQIRLRHSSYWKISNVSHPAAHAFSFTLYNTAFLVQNVSGSRFIRLLNNNDLAEEWLNEPRGPFLPLAYARLKYRILNINTFKAASAGFQYYREWTASALDSSPDTLLRWSSAVQSAWADTMLSHVTNRNLGLTWKNALDIARKQTFLALFPLQRNLADFMGASHYNPSDRPRLIRPAFVDSLRRKLEPGDLLLNRSNWILSNTGLPGFWPHITLYAGSPAELVAYFKGDSATREAVRIKSSGTDSTVENYLAHNHPKAWIAFSSDSLGIPRRVVEALANGVVIRPLEQTCHADYLAAIRPNVSKKDKALALIYAFSVLGTEYDFDFDFATDATLVCSEVVYKAYQPRAELDHGIRIPLQDILGRWTLPPNDYAALFAAERGSARPQFRFVAFLDGSEKSGLSYFAGEEAFSQSCTRVKWDFLQE